MGTYTTISVNPTKTASPGQFKGFSTRAVARTVSARDRNVRVSFAAGFKLWESNVTKYPSAEEGVAALHSHLDDALCSVPEKKPVVIVLWRTELMWYYGTVIAFDMATKVATIDYKDGVVLKHALTVNESDMDTFCALVY